MTFSLSLSLSVIETLRGSKWRGRDCDDGKADVYPGRLVSNYPVCPFGFFFSFSFWSHFLLFSFVTFQNTRQISQVDRNFLFKAWCWSQLQWNLRCQSKNWKAVGRWTLCRNKSRRLRSPWWFCRYISHFQCTTSHVLICYIDHPDNNKPISKVHTFTFLLNG